MRMHRVCLNGTSPDLVQIREEASEALLSLSPPVSILSSTLSTSSLLSVSNLFSPVLYPIFVTPSFSPVSVLSHSLSYSL